MTRLLGAQARLVEGMTHEEEIRWVQNQPPDLGGHVELDCSFILRKLI
jgi:hypothetical protein